MYINNRCSSCLPVHWMATLPVFSFRKFRSGHRTWVPLLFDETTALSVCLVSSIDWKKTTDSGDAVKNFGHYNNKKPNLYLFCSLDNVYPVCPSVVLNMILFHSNDVSFYAYSTRNEVKNLDTIRKFRFVLGYIIRGLGK